MMTAADLRRILMQRDQVRTIYMTPTPPGGPPRVRHHICHLNCYQVSWLHYTQSQTQARHSKYKELRRPGGRRILIQSAVHWLTNVLSLGGQPGHTTITSCK